jgi:hypothetical protein
MIGMYPELLLKREMQVGGEYMFVLVYVVFSFFLKKGNAKERTFPIKGNDIT